MDRRVTPPKGVTSPTWGPPPPCKQALNVGVETNFCFEHNSAPESAVELYCNYVTIKVITRNKKGTNLPLTLFCFVALGLFSCFVFNFSLLN